MGAFESWRPNRRRSQVNALAGLLAIAVTALALAEPVHTSRSNRTLRAFIRFETTARDQGHLDTAARSYARADGVNVSLIAAVHVGDRAYYERLQKLFEGYDALLYEMIREGGARAPVRPDSDHPVSQVQLGLKNLLNLDYQLDVLDYSRTNFVHADLDPETFSRLQAERGESILGLMLRAALEEDRRQQDDPKSTLSSFQMFWALVRNDRSHQLKFLLGQQMDQLEAAAAGLDQDGPTVLVSGRNEKAIEVLRAQVNQGKRRLGIFYGAGHMPDLERRLLELEFKPAGEQWLTAWDLRPAPAAGPSTGDSTNTIR